MSTFDRVAYLDSRDRRAAERAASRRTLGEALDIANLALIRIRCRWDRNLTPYNEVIGYTADFRRLDFEAAVQADLFDWARMQFPAVNWVHDHQIWLASGCIHAAPDADEPGFLPDEDESFGGAPAVYLTAVTA